MMTNKTAVWSQIIETMNAFAPFYRKDARANLRQVNARHTWLPLLKTAVANSDP